MEPSHTTSNNDNILRTINIQKILFDKEQFIPLLSIADPSVNMIQSYLFKGELYVLSSNGQAISAAVIISVGDKEFELKNLSTLYNQQKKGYGSILLTKILELYSNADKIWVGTGSPGWPRNSRSRGTDRWTSCSADWGTGESAACIGSGAYSSCRE